MHPLVRPILLGTGRCDPLVLDAQPEVVNDFETPT
jgi:hypothetical protein